METAEKFWETVSPEPNTGCWIWAGGGSHGYGAVRWRDRPRLAHRVAFFLAPGREPAGLMHTCDTPACVNPTRPREGSQSENMADMARKGRHVGYRKVSLSEVAAIRQAHAAGSATRSGLAASYRIGRSNVSQIVNQKTWSDK